MKSTAPETIKIEKDPREIALERIKKVVEEYETRIDLIPTLDLSNLGLVEIPTKVFELVWLQKLNLSNNKLTTIPIEILKLTDLDRFNFDGNDMTYDDALKFDRSVCERLVGGDKSTRIRTITYNAPIGNAMRRVLSGKPTQDKVKTPREIALERIKKVLDQHNFQNLRPPPLDLSNLGLTEIPWEVFELVWLERLNLSNNKLTTIPVGILKLTNLEEFDFYGNDMTYDDALKVDRKVCERLFGKGKIRGIAFDTRNGDAMRCVLSSKPPQDKVKTPREIALERIKKEVERHERLIKPFPLDLSGLGLTEIPTNVFELVWLRELDLSGNKLTTIPVGILRLTHLEKLDVWDNNMTYNDALKIDPKVCEKLNQLKITCASQVKDGIVGVLKKVAIKRIEEVVEAYESCAHPLPLDLSNLGLTEIPTEVFDLVWLEKLNLSNNKLTTIPIEILKLVNLNRFNLTNNNMSRDNVLKFDRRVCEMLSGGVGPNRITWVTFPSQKIIDALREVLSKPPPQDKDQLRSKLHYFSKRFGSKSNPDYYLYLIQKIISRRALSNVKDVVEDLVEIVKVLNRKFVRDGGNWLFNQTTFAGLNSDITFIWKDFINAVAIGFDGGKYTKVSGDDLMSISDVEMWLYAIAYSANKPVIDSPNFKLFSFFWDQVPDGILPIVPDWFERRKETAETYSNMMEMCRKQKKRKEWMDKILSIEDQLEQLKVKLAELKN